MKNECFKYIHDNRNTCFGSGNHQSFTKLEHDANKIQT